MKESIYNFKTVNVNQCHKEADLVESVITGQLGGFIVEGFLDDSEVESIKKGFFNLSKDEVVQINESFNSYPMSFAQLEQFVQSNKLTEEKYFEISEQYINNFTDKFGVDFTDKFINLFAQISNKKFEWAYYKDKRNKLIPYNFRQLKYPGGNLKSHCEQYFMSEFPSFYSRLSAISDHSEQLSFFVVLSNPEKGGELTLFDILWPNFKKRIGDHVVVEESTGKQFDLDKGEIASMSIKPKVGSLLVFSGGHIWHRVEKVKETPERLTVGGFISFSFDKKTMYPWS